MHHELKGAISVYGRVSQLSRLHPGVTVFPEERYGLGGTYAHCVVRSLPRCRPEDPSLLLAGARDLTHWSRLGLTQTYIISLQPRCGLECSDPGGCADRPAGASKLMGSCSL